MKKIIKKSNQDQKDLVDKATTNDMVKLVGTFLLQYLQAMENYDARKAEDLRNEFDVTLALIVKSTKDKEREDECESEYYRGHEDGSDGVRAEY